MNPKLKKKQESWKESNRLQEYDSLYRASETGTPTFGSK
jgi:hypothetical protein